MGRSTEGLDESRGDMAMPDTYEYVDIRSKFL